MDRAVVKCDRCGWFVGGVGQTLCQACWIEERKENTQMLPLLANAGHAALYGGGSESKGHGYWIEGRGWISFAEAQSLIA